MVVSCRYCRAPTGSDRLFGFRSDASLKHVKHTVAKCDHVDCTVLYRLTRYWRASFVHAIAIHISLRHLFLTHGFSPQWSYGFYLIHLQGKQGFQFFCKTEENKRKWMEQFDMAMWVKNLLRMLSFFLSEAVILYDIHLKKYQLSVMPLEKWI